MRKWLKPGLMMVALLLALAMARAQDASGQTSTSQQSGSPTSANSTSNSGPASTVSGVPENAPPAIVPDNHPLTGMDLLGLGTVAEGRSYILPDFTIGEVGNTNTFVEPGLVDYETTTIPMVSVVLEAMGKKNVLSASYEGGGLIYNKRSSLDTYFQMADFSDVLQGARWQLELSDRLSAVPEASFGFTGLGIIGGFGANPAASLGLSSGMGELSPMVAPETSVLTGVFAQFSNTVAAQATYSVSPTSSFTALGAFGYLHFSQGGFLSANDAVGQLGFNHQLTEKDSMGLVYSYSVVFYPGLTNSLHTQMAGISYGRKVTGRMAFQAFAGPEFSTIKQGPVSLTQTVASGLASLTYALRRGSLGIRAARFIEPGSGVVSGTTADIVSFDAGYRITSAWNGNVSLGFAQNSALPNTRAPFGTRFRYTFANATLTRPLGRHMSVHLGYELQYQNSNSGLCNALVCGHAPALNIFGIGLSFFPNPIGI
ncbi:MAG: hypothetical protein ACRD3T_04995 [Terriglobia bacterium]